MWATIIDIPFNKKELDWFMYYHRDYDSRPVVYLIKWKKYIYIGETTNAYKRMKDHLKNGERTDVLDEISIIYDPEYNKSATLDIESKLIEYISAEDSFILQNRNDGIRDHHYYDREKYLAKFEDIWKDLQEKEIVHKDLNEIRKND